MKTTTDRKSGGWGRVWLFLLLALSAWPSGLHAQGSGSLILSPAGREVGIIKPYPWSGWWWPWNGVPLAKVLTRYDKFVEGRTGKNPGAASWERKHHRGGEEWAGHCNGWSAAASLEAEPVVPRTVDGQEFSVAEQKGLLTEMYMDCYHQFYGTRCYQDSADPDIHPHHFHRLLLEFIKERQVPIVIDTDAGSPVWNFPVYAFETVWTTDPRRGRAEVTTKVYLADDNVVAGYLGTKGIVKTYKYTLELNPAGEVTGGKWARGTGSRHPDFVWVPTADSPPAGWQNPNIDPVQVRAIVGAPAPPPPASFPASLTAVLEAMPAATGEAAYDQVLREAGLDPEVLFDRTP